MTKKLTIHQGLFLLFASGVALTLASGCQGSGDDGSTGPDEMGGAAGAAGAPGDGGMSSAGSGSGGEATSGGTGGTSSGSTSSGGNSASGGTGGGNCVDDDSCSCEPGERWDAEADECVPGVCAADEGLFQDTGECFRCSPEVSCGGAGETGLQLATLAVDDATCICETKDGYFPGSDGGIAELCDADGDGWVTDKAQPSVESENEVIRKNARCDVRRIRSFYLSSETGHTFNTESDDDLAVPFPGDDDIPPGLPLYENAGNDADPDGKLPFYRDPGKGRRLDPKELNSLTKVCLGINTDANQNGISDVREWSGIGVGRTFANEQLRRYYEKYTEYSYFLALHDGWWDEGIYRIAERNRTASPNTKSLYQIGIGYESGTPDHAMTCDRHADSLFKWSSTSALAPETITVGGDFVRFADSNMLHHSQFKCVHVVAPSDYKDSSAEERPELVFIQGDEVRRREEGVWVDHTWTFNDCDAKGRTQAGVGANPEVPEMTCEVSSPAEDTVSWAAVHYEPYTNRWQSLQDPGGYTRGCSSECADRGLGSECTHCPLESWGEAAPKPSGTACGDGESCDGEGDCGGCLPSDTRCKGDDRELCEDDRAWHFDLTCTYGCNAQVGTCHPDCRPNDVSCSAQGKPQICNSTGKWQEQPACSPTQACAGGECLKADGQLCSSDGECASDHCKQWYRDDDGDGYGDGFVKYCGTAQPPKTATAGGDCCDDDENAFPGQTQYFGGERKVCGGYDYDCNDAVTKKYTTFNACVCPATGDGWLSGYIPACGHSEKWGRCIFTTGGGCTPTGMGNRTQACR